MALGAEKAIQEAGRINKMWILGGAGMKDIVKRVMKRSHISGDITYPPAMIAAGIDIAVAQLKDGNITAAVGKTPEHLGITKEQLEQAASKQGQKRSRLMSYDHSRERRKVLLSRFGVLNKSGPDEFR